MNNEQNIEKNLDNPAPEEKSQRDIEIEKHIGNLFSKKKLKKYLLSEEVLEAYRKEGISDEDIAQIQINKMHLNEILFKKNLPAILRPPLKSYEKLAYQLCLGMYKNDYFVFSCKQEKGKVLYVLHKAMDLTKNIEYKINLDKIINYDTFATLLIRNCEKIIRDHELLKLTSEELLSVIENNQKKSDEYNNQEKA